MKTAIIAITPRGAELARRIGQALPEAQVYLPERLRQEDGCGYFSEPLAELLPRLFSGGQALVCIMSIGIVARLLAPVLKGKDVDPAVVVMDEAGEYAIPLFSGHLGGANALARQLAELAGGQAVITTATDVNGLPAWDEVARINDLVVEPIANIRHLNSMLLQGDKIALVDRSGRIASCFEGVKGVFRCSSFSAAVRSGAAGQVFVTHRSIPEAEIRSDLLLLRPRDLVVGIGCNRGTSAAEIAEVIAAEFKRGFLSVKSIACLASIDAKADEAGLLEYAGKAQLDIEFHHAEALNAVSTPAPDSPHALAAVGAKGVCEPAAILSSGRGSLLVTKKKRGNVTLAVAEKV